MGLFSDAWHRLAYAVAVIVDVFVRPVHVDEPIKRDPLLSMKKLFAEGSLEEEKTILGWDLDFCGLTAALTEEKFAESAADIEEIIEARENKHKEVRHRSWHKWTCLSSAQVRSAFSESLSQKNR